MSAWSAKKNLVADNHFPRHFNLGLFEEAYINGTCRVHTQCIYSVDREMSRIATINLLDSLYRYR